MKTYGISHIPLMVTVEENKRRSGDLIAFIGRQLCFFDKRSEEDRIVPKIGEMVEVMITRAHYHRFPVGHERENQFDTNRVLCLMVDIVDPKKHVLVAMDGFERTPSTKRALSSGVVSSGEGHVLHQDSGQCSNPNGVISLTPGRCGIHAVPNGDPRVPTNVYVDRELLHSQGGRGVRVEGLTRIQDGVWYPLIRRGSRPVVDKSTFKKEGKG